MEILDTAARERADNVAFECGDSRITQERFAQSSAGLAKTLREHGVAPGDRVAILLPKSIAAVASMAAALRCGAAYVPIDPFQPAARIRQILEDCSCSVIVAERSLADGETRAALPAATPVLCFEELPRGSTRTAFALPRNAEDLAFILYTSGSTGRPKGVTVSHRNLLTFLNWCLQELDLSWRDTFSNHASFTFDLSTFDIYAALAVGGTVKIFTEAEMREPFALAEAIERHRITVWYSVPSTLRLLLASGALERYDTTSLRYVLFAGEAFPIKQVATLQEKIPGAVLYNLYGPTETNVCTYHRVRPMSSGATSPLPIGRPLPDVHLTIVDERGEPVPRGETGELVVAGPCVTRGYWNQRGCANHQRGIHATGDLVSLDPEGELLFHGRIDDMVKVAGYRVELGEVEHALALHPGIEQVAVVAVEAEDRILLHACYTGPQRLSLLDLKAFCRDRLPLYMIPNRAHHYGSLPLNRNGKIDRLALARDIAGHGS